MCQKMVHPLIVAGFVMLASSSGTVAAEVLLSNGKPDPAYNKNAMQVWLRADLGVTVRDGRVAIWMDQSKHGHHAKQTDADDQPRHVPSSRSGRDVIQFAGDGEHLKFASGFGSTFDGSFTVFAVVTPDDGDPDRDDVWFGLVENSTDNRVILATDGNSDAFAALYKADGNSDNTLVVPNPFSDGPAPGPVLISWVVRSGGLHEVFINGHPQAAASIQGNADNSRFTSGTRTACLGSAQNSDGSLFPSTATSFAGGISEFMLYDGALGSREREAVEDYLLQGRKLIGTPIRVSSATQLFVDDHLIASSAGLRKTVHQWERHP